MTKIESALFDDWESWNDREFRKHQWPATGERLSRSSFTRFREQGGFLISHVRTEEMTRTAIASPLTMIASDGMITNGKGHPRTSGTFAKVLGKFVREDGVLTLKEALRKMTIEPARRLEEYVPAMRNKGRLKAGADADITIFDADTVIDRSTYTDPTLPSHGIEFVLVNGVLVVDEGELVPDTSPGRAIRVQ
jgi:dihydroorotase